MYAEPPKRAVLAACVLCSSLVGMDAMMTTVALPAIAEDLGVGLAMQQWVVAAFLLASGSLLIAGGHRLRRTQPRHLTVAGARFDLSVACDRTTQQSPHEYDLRSHNGSADVLAQWDRRPRPK